MRVPRLSEWEPILVEWVDSNGGEAGWTEITRRDQDIHGCVTVGQVYSQEDDRITVVLTRDGELGEMVHGYITIPTVAITRLVRLQGA
jgi:hypothetical protein